jgi:hypothetical protein
MRLVKTEDYRGYKIRVFGVKRLRVFIGGVATYTDYSVYVDGEEVSEYVLMCGTSTPEQWVEITKRMIDENFPFNN